MSRVPTAELRPTRGGTHVTEGEDGPRLEHRVLRLSVTAGPDRGRRFELASTHVTLGSSRGSDIRLSDDAVSGRHCEIRVIDDRVIVRDCGSTNGTFLNGIRVGEAELPVGGRIRVGRTELRFQPRRESRGLAPSEAPRFGELYGSSPAMREVFGLLEKVAPTDLGVLLRGETGTGKELAARSIHAASKRADAPFVIVDCAAISASLSESELFGHEKGAFTGASRTQLGPFEAARGGTVFLDEVGELPLGLQKNLLRVLEARQVRRVGGTEWLDVSYRLVAATHRDLIAMVRAGGFREDLYYRMAEVEAHLPPLRERQGDVLWLAEQMLAATSEHPPVLDDDARALLCAAPWEGNVRELRNVMRRASAFAEHGSVSAEQLRSAGVRTTPATHADTGPEIDAERLAGMTIREARELAVRPIERSYLVQLIERHGTDLDGAAHEAGMHRKSLLRLLREHDLRPSWLPNRPTNE